MLRMHPDERAHCAQVVEGLEAISAKASKDENYCIRGGSGRLRHADVDASIRPLSRLAFDPTSMQILEEEDFLQLNMSGNSLQETQLSWEDVSPTHPYVPSGGGPRYARHSYSDTAAPDTQIAHEIPGRFGAPGLNNQQERSWFHRLFCGCFT